MSATLVYPQLMQYPVVKRRKMRTVLNRSADGRTISLADAAGESTEWQLQYAGLSDSELETLEQFFAAAEGTLNGFTFLDPEANLLAYSGVLDNPAWAAGPKLTVTGERGFYTLQNTAAAAQSISQTLGAAPAEYVYCLSATVRATPPASGSGTAGITMMIGSGQSARTVGTEWERIVFAATADTAAFGLEFGAGVSVDVSGIQVEAQPGASVYRATTTGGVYAGARLGTDQLQILTSGVNRHGCQVTVVYNNHI